MRFTPHQYQRDAAAFLATHLGSCLYADPGTGKTAITLMLLTELLRRGEIRPPILIVGPMRTLDLVWGEEIHKWDQFQHLTYTIRRGKFDASAQIHLTNYEQLGRFSLRDYRTVIIDEASNFKNWKAQRTITLRANRPYFDRVHLLSGTPTPKSLLDLFSQIFIAARPCPLGDSFYLYRSQYFENVNDLLAKWVDRKVCNGARRLSLHELMAAYDILHPDSPEDKRKFVASYFRQKYFAQRLKGISVWPDWQPREGAAERIYQRLASSCYRLDASQLLELPEILINDIPVELPTAIQRKSVSALAAYLADPQGNPDSFVVARRATGGVTPQGEWEHRAKLDAVRGLVGELQGKPCLVFFEFRSEGEALAREFQAPLIYGNVKRTESDAIIRRWDRGELPVLLCQPQSTAYGLNLQHGGNDVCWFSPTTRAADYVQGCDRVYRQGVRGKVRIHRLIASKSVDTGIYRATDTKLSAQQDLLDALRDIVRENDTERI